MADKYVMLVEGPDDFHVIQHLLTAHQVNDQVLYHLEGHRLKDPVLGRDNIVFKAREGVQNVLDYLSQQLRITGDLQAMGVVVDADLDLSARWQSLRDVLIKSGYADIPKEPNPSGIILVQEEKPLVGLWIMPNNTLPGMMEDFFRLLVPADDVLWKRAKLCVDQIPETERLFGKNALMKAHVHTWLAWQERPGLPMGQAINNRYLNPNAPEAILLVNWLLRLFDLKNG
jgi:hypothetical protein